MKILLDIGRNAALFGALLLSSAAGAGPPPSQAPPQPSPQEVTLYLGQGADTDLPDLPGKAARGTLQFDQTWFTGAGFAYPDVPAAGVRTALGWVGLQNSSSAKELVIVKHSGKQSHVEWGALYLLRTPYAALGPVRLRAGAGIGFSYAWGRPSYEDGPLDEPDRRYKLQNFDAYELETGIAAWPRLAFVGRVHHRSGAYGLIAPRNVGSNFLTVSLRYAF